MGCHLSKIIWELHRNILAIIYNLTAEMLIFTLTHMYILNNNYGRPYSCGAVKHLLISISNCQISIIILSSVKNCLMVTQISEVF